MAARRRKASVKRNTHEGHFRIGLCTMCHWKHIGSNSCDAYPNGYPERYANGSAHHLTRDGEDGGIAFLAMLPLTKAVCIEIAGRPDEEPEQERAR